MKKAMYVALAVAVALSMATCELFENLSNEPEAPVYDEQGRRMIKLSIFTGDTGRNMNEQLARLSINYYEVMFYDSAFGYYRTYGPRGRTLTIRLPQGFGVGNQGDRAVVFAGYRNTTTDERTLYAVGITTHLNYGIGAGISTASTPTIGLNTENIRFELAAVNTSFALANTASFQISSPADYITAPTSGDTSNSLTISGSSFQLNHLPEQGTNNMYPFWKLPKTTDSVFYPAAKAQTEATFKYGLSESRLKGIIPDIEDDDTFRFESWRIETDDAADGATAVDAKPDFSVLTRAAFVPEEIPMTIFSEYYPYNQGFCLLVPNIPVRAISLNPNNGVTNELWTLSNGIGHALHDNNALINAQTNKDLPIVNMSTTSGASLGGALLLCVGDPPSANGKPIKIIIHWPNS